LNHKKFDSAAQKYYGVYKLIFYDKSYLIKSRIVEGAQLTQDGQYEAATTK